MLPSTSACLKYTVLFPRLAKNEIIFSFNAACRSLNTIRYSTVSSPSQLHVSPKYALVDDILNIRVSGLNDNQLVTLLLRLEDDGKRLYSCAHYEADVTGNLNLNRAPSVGGLFTGVEPMGLFWSMKQEPGQKPGVRIIKKNATTPITTSLAVYDGHHDNVPDLIAMQPLTTTLLDRWYMSNHVMRTEVNEDNIRGTFFIPKEGGPYPGVVDMFGGIGGTVEHRAALLASRGFATLALEYITHGQEDEIQSNLRYFKNAVEWVLDQPRVRNETAGLVATSKGGDIALLTATVCDKISALIAINAWHFSTLFGHEYEDLTFPAVQVTPEDCIFKDGAISLKASANNALSNEMRKRCAIPIEKANCQIMLVNSEDDECTDASSQSHLIRRMEKHGKSHLCEGVMYSGAGHLLEPPHTPHYYATYSAVPGAPMLWGGEPLAHARAQEDLWKRTLIFLRKYIR